MLRVTTLMALVLLLADCGKTAEQVNSSALARISAPALTGLDRRAYLFASLKV